MAKGTARQQPSRAEGVPVAWWDTGWATVRTGWITARQGVAWARLSLPGLVVAVLFICASLTPSLLPRTWQAQGIVSGLSGSIGYGLGVVVAALMCPAWRWATRGRVLVSHRVATWIRGAIAIATLALLSLTLYYGSVWQRSLHVLIGEPPPARLGYIRVLLVTCAIVAVGVAFVRSMEALVRWTIGRAERVVPKVPATISGVTILAVTGILLADAAVRTGFPSLASSMSAATNDTTGGGTTPPAAATRSGSPQSLVSWDSLGREGRSFVGGGPSLADLRAYTGSGAKDPIRVYVGLKSAPTAATAADLAVRELERTGASSRSVLCVVTTTGTGWVDPYAAAALEYLAGGDTAIVGTQFSYLPSWISFLTERDRAVQAGRALFDRVYAYWSSLPAGHRPRLVVFGESLGSLGSEAVFRDLDDLRARTDGALWIGPTNANPLWTKLVAERDPGSTEVLPVYGGGQTVRFASRPHDLDAPPGPWPLPRVVYVQNPSDPVTWWSPGLLFDQPDWLTEPRGYDVQPAMRWYPLVTFLQVTADLALAQRAPTTHGHYFHGATVAAWAAILQPPGWTPDRSTALTRHLDHT